MLLTVAWSFVDDYRIQNLVECTLKGQVEVKASKPSSTSCNFYPIAAGAGPSTPEPHPIEVRSTGDGNGSYETFAPKTLRKLPEVPRFSNLLTELRRERQEKLFSLVGDHTLLRDQFKYHCHQNREDASESATASGAARGLCQFLVLVMSAETSVP